MDSESEIVVNGYTNLSHTNFRSCTNDMYKGLKLNAGQHSASINSCKFYDARIAIEMYDIGHYISFCTFDRNWTGIKLDGTSSSSAPGFNNCKFLCNGTLLNDASNTTGNLDRSKQGVWVVNNASLRMIYGYFKDLHDGITSENSTVAVDNVTFRNLYTYNENPCDYLINDGGYAINLLNSTGRIIRGCNMYQLHSAIRAQSSKLDLVSNNTTDSVIAGIYDLNAMSKSKIFPNNNFTFDRHGVYAISPIPGIAPIIQSNTFTISPRPTHPERRAVSLINAKASGGDVSLNDFNLDIGCWGVFMESSTGIYIHENNINFSLEKPDDVVLSSGIELRGSNYNYIINNPITSSVQDENVPEGIIIKKGIQNIVCCNNVINPVNAYKFTGSSPRTTWYGNRSQGTYSNGLVIEDGFFGPQPDSRNPKAGQVSQNTWAPSQQSQRIDAILIRSINQLSKIKAAGCSLPTWPQNINPSQSCSSSGTDWFTTVNVTVTTPCLSSSICQIPITELRRYPEEYFSDTDIAVAEGELSGETNGEILQWDGARQLYQLLRFYPIFFLNTPH